MAKLTKAIIGVPDGEIYPREIPAGEDCPENLLDYALGVGALEGDGAKTDDGKKPVEPVVPEKGTDEGSKDGEKKADAAKKDSKAS